MEHNVDRQKGAHMYFVKQQLEKERRVSKAREGKHFSGASIIIHERVLFTLPVILIFSTSTFPVFFLDNPRCN